MFDMIDMNAIFQPHWVRKLTGKPAFLTIADCESEARRIHLSDCNLTLRYVEQRLPRPVGLIQAGSFNCCIYWLPFLWRKAHGDAWRSGLALWLSGSAHFWFHKNTLRNTEIIVDSGYFAYYAKSTIKNAMANILNKLGHRQDYRSLALLRNDIYHWFWIGTHAKYARILKGR